MRSSRSVAFAALLLFVGCTSQSPSAKPERIGTVGEELSGMASAAANTVACNGATAVTVSLDGASTTSATPVDLELIIDESGSIVPTDFTQVKTFMKNLVNGLPTLFQYNGSVGITLFTTTARTILPPTQSKNAVIDAIAGITQNAGMTCTGCGVRMATSALTARDPSHKRVAIVVTDGGNNTPSTGYSNYQTDLTAALTLAQNANVKMVAVGVGGAVNQAELQQIATGAGSENVFQVSQYSGLNSLLQSLTAAVTIPEATNATLDLQVNPAFFVSGGTVSQGALTVSDNHLVWTIPEIKNQTVTLTYTVTHDPNDLSGSRLLHTAATYTDQQGNPLVLNPVSIQVVNCDRDGDGVNDEQDNCPDVPNASQANNDGDAQGDACDPDDDNDGVPDTIDNCSLVVNPDQADNDGDGLGNACDPDDDNDGILDTVDNCQFASNPDQADHDGDGIGDVCDSDDDNDGILDTVDNCQFAANPDQADFDHDGQGDVCDPDDDNDGVADSGDKCPQTPPNTTVDADGCSVAQLCACVAPWKNHGEYVSCVAHATQVFVASGLINSTERSAIVSEAGRSTCGK